MALNIETFTNKGWRPGNNAGGSTLFKAYGHPLTADLARKFLVGLSAMGAIAIYDPLGQAEHFNSFYNLGACDIAGVFVQNLDDVDTEILGITARPVTELVNAQCRVVMICAFDADGFAANISDLVPKGVEVVSFDNFRLPDDMLSVPKNYLDPLNFATNFGLLMEGDGHHTQISSANYWGSYGAPDPALWLSLFDEDGKQLAQWIEPLPGPGAVYTLDSVEIRDRFGLGDFTGSLFMHAIRIKGHDVMKYVVDTYSDDDTHLSGTHDANAWPADFYAGLPAPDAGEQVTLLIQNSHPVDIPGGEIGLGLMGSQDVHLIKDVVPAFGTYSVDIEKFLPDAAWPDQIEVKAGRFFVRPRYTATDKSGRIRFGHMNVERTDLVADENIPKLGETMGKGYILPMPILPVADFVTELLPTPMTTAQSELPIALAVYDADGTEIAREFLGCIPRRTSKSIDMDAFLKGAKTPLSAGYGHMELHYDFSDGGMADGWLHALVRFQARNGGHRAETTFGAHIYNTPTVYRDEPQSYTKRPPGLTTRLFLRLAPSGMDTLCHLIYPASLPWRSESTTQLTAFSSDGKELGSKEINIPCGGSSLWRMSEMFDADVANRAGGGYVVIRDTTCRLFGYHGLIRGDIHNGGAFSLDHAFGF
ncbi:MAG: hypothetical protein ACKVJQ_00825 [Alphaproteobacteria bacterium]|jgi:hypothetical protein